MYFLVGWHYVKQVFGCVIVTSVQRKIFYKTWERRLILTNLFSMWGMSSLRSHVGLQSYDFYGIAHYSLNLPESVLTFVYWSVAISGVAVVGLHVRKYIEEGTKPSPPAVAALASLYVWYLPCFSHPGFGYLIPFFHSLQYMVFVWSLKRNQVTDQNKKLEGRAWRMAWVQRFLGFLLAAYVLGALAFEFIPKFLDQQNFVPEGSLGYAPFLAAFLLFINIHHYFIDNVIWRSDNVVVKKFLFKSSPDDNKAGGPISAVKLVS
jgi:hypothetical protein